MKYSDSLSKSVCALSLFICASILAGCQSANSKAAPASGTVSAETQSSGQSSIPALVQGVCGDCHGVEPPFLSPNEDAPGFDAIANSAGLTGESLTNWLIDAHNYPELMEFALTKEEARKVSEYMVTLQSEDYVPAS